MINIMILQTLCWIIFAWRSLSSGPINVQLLMNSFQLIQRVPSIRRANIHNHLTNCTILHGPLKPAAHDDVFAVGQRLRLSKSNDGPLEIKCLIKHCKPQLAAWRSCGTAFDCTLSQTSPVTHFHILTQGHATDSGCHAESCCSIHAGRDCCTIKSHACTCTPSHTFLSFFCFWGPWTLAILSHQGWDEAFLRPAKPGVGRRGVKGRESRREAVEEGRWGVNATV